MFPAGESRSSIDSILAELSITKSFSQKGEPLYSIPLLRDSEQHIQGSAHYDALSKRWILSSVKAHPSSLNYRGFLGDDLHASTESSSKMNVHPLIISDAAASNGDERTSSLAQSIASKTESKLGDSWPENLTPMTDHVRFFLETDWSSTSLGPLASWSTTLRLMTQKLFSDPRAACLYWGPDRIAIYNEPFVPLVSQVHPMLMGSVFRLALASTWDVMRHVFDDVEQTKVAAHLPEIELSLERDKYLEETYFNAAFIPLRGETGIVEGFYNSVYEVTRQRMTDRRSSMLNTIASTPDFRETSVWEHIFRALETLERDVPMAIVYSAEEESDTKRCILKLEGALGIHPGHVAVPLQADLHKSAEGFIPYFREAREKGDAVTIDALPSYLSAGVEWRGFGEPPNTIVVVPLTGGLEVAGFLALGINPRRAYDKDYQQFVQDLSFIVSTSIKSSIDFDKMRARELQLEKKLSETEKFVRRMAEIAPVGLVNLTVEGMITWANAKFYEITGLSSRVEDKYELSFMSCVLEEDREEALHIWKDASLHQKSGFSNLRLQRTWQPLPIDDNEGKPVPEHVWIMNSMLPVSDSPVARSVMACVTDISILKWAESVQANAAQKAQEAKIQQERFVDITSHEIRNPLSAVVQCADAILTSLQGRMSGQTSGTNVDELLEEVLDAAQMIVSLTAHQHRIVDDILTLSKLDSGMLPLALIVTDILIVAKDTLKMFKADLEAADIRATLDCDPTMDKYRARQVYCDPSRIRQILINLLTNAIKFTKGSPTREIRMEINASHDKPTPKDNTKDYRWFPSKLTKRNLAASAVDEHGGQVFIGFSVEDTGKGIDAEEMTRLFNRFAQANVKTHINYGGSGLGLFISRELTEMHGGMIGAESRVGKGSAFKFYIKTFRGLPSNERENSHTGTFPLRNSLSASKPSKAIRNAGTNDQATTQRVQRRNSDLHILLVEDNILNQKVLAKQLRKAGCTVYVANHGEEALDFLPRTRHWSPLHKQTTAPAKSSPPQQLLPIGLDLTLILMDWEMPIMDGLTCSKQIRRLEKEGSMKGRILIVGTTANAREAQIRIAMEAGMDDVVTKPFTVPELLERIDKLLSG